MKSELFSKYFLPSSKRKEIIQKAFSIDEKQLLGFAKWFENLESDPKTTGAGLVIRISDLNELKEKTGIEKDLYEDIKSFLFFILEEMYDRNDSVENITDDLIESELITSFERDLLLEFISSTYKKFTSFIKDAELVAVYRKFSKTIESTNYSTCLYQIPKVDYQTNDPIEEYKPEFYGFYPVASVSLSFENDDSNNDVTFQVNTKELDDLISKLQACQKELRLMEKTIQKL